MTPTIHLSDETTPQMTRCGRPCADHDLRPHRLCEVPEADWPRVCGTCLQAERSPEAQAFSAQRAAATLRTRLARLRRR